MKGWVGRGWRFAHPDLGAPQKAGFRLSNRGGIETLLDQDLVRQAIHLLLTTRRGERVMRPDYGCELDRLVFLPNDPTTAGLAIHYVRRALDRWEPRIEILELDASPHPEDPSCLLISLDYRIGASGFEDRLQLPVDLSGGGE